MVDVEWNTTQYIYKKKKKNKEHCHLWQYNGTRVTRREQSQNEKDKYQTSHICGKNKEPEKTKPKKKKPEN